MSTKFSDFRKAMTMQLTDYIECQARAVTRADLDSLMANLPVVRQCAAEIPVRTYACLSDQIEFLCRFVEENIPDQTQDTIGQAVAEAAFALLYFQRRSDLIPDAIPHIGVLDDAMIVSMVLRRHDQVFKGSAHAHLLEGTASEFDVEDLLSVVSPLRVSSFCSSSGTPSKA
jgi:uncharacterized membrane protein YkvA (DUF1232 family)